jgi:tripartite-type tricarboxylate transporter receptor subunit TctC
MDEHVLAAAVRLDKAETLGGVEPLDGACSHGLAQAPGLPTVDEAGLPGFYFSAWHGLWVPKGTPAAIVATLSAAARAALADTSLRERLTGLGQDIPPKELQTPAALAAQQKAEIEKWAPIIRAENIKVE